MNNKKLALIAGVSLLLMAVIAAYSYGYVYMTLINKGDYQFTLKNLEAHTGLFISSLVGWALIFILDIIVSWSLLRFFEDEHPIISKLTAIFRYVYCGFLAVAIVFLAQSLAYLNSGQNSPEILWYFNAFEYTWTLGLIPFGIHLFGLSVLCFKSPELMHKIFGWMLLLASLSYLLVHSQKSIYPNDWSQFERLENVLTAPMAIGELAFAFWLIYYSVSKKKSF